MYRLFFKRAFDLSFSLTLLLVLLPVFFLLVVVLAFHHKGKPFFIQSRPGKDEKIFGLLKFKTMRDQKDRSGRLLPDEDRLTLLGAIIRKTSLDELPQLINVIRGDMSLIGPRPLLDEYLPLYTATQRRRHTVKPGITGWAQVNGRNAISWNEKFRLDIWYVDHISFRLDFKILLLTVLKVFKSEGISSGTSVTMEKFNGN